MKRLSDAEFIFNLKDGFKVKLAYTLNYDNLLSKYDGDSLVEEALLFNCGIVPAFPSILRYCFENNINLEERDFLKGLSVEDMTKFNHFDTKFALDLPSKYKCNGVKSINGNLVIRAGDGQNNEITFKPEDVAELVEGIIKVLDCDALPDAYIVCKQMLQYYHSCLGEGNLKK